MYIFVMMEHISECIAIHTAGIGTLNGCSIVVQYQAEINRLQHMVNRTKGRVEEIERLV
jgi:hypothetical protein